MPYVKYWNGTSWIALDAKNADTVTTVPQLTGDITTTGSTNATTLKNTGTAGTYTKVTTDAQGRVSSGSTPTTLSGYSASMATNISNSTLTTTSATYGTFTPTAQGNFMVFAYLRVATATSIDVQVNWTDSAGVQSLKLVNAGDGTQAVGSYALPVVFVNATTGGAVSVTAVAGAATAVFISTSIVAL